MMVSRARSPSAPAEVEWTVEQYRALLAAIPDVMMRIRQDGMVLDVRPPRGIETLPFRPGARLRDVLPADLSARALEHVHQALRTGEPEVLAYRHSGRQGIRDFEARLVPSGRDEVLALVRDTSEQRRAADRLRFLAEVGARLPATLDAGTVIREVTRAAVGTFADCAVVYLVTAHGLVEQSASCHADPSSEGLFHALEGRSVRDVPDGAMVARVLCDGEPLLWGGSCQGRPGVPLHAAGGDLPPLLREMDVRSAVWAPLVARGRTLGILGLFALAARPRYALEDLHVACDVALRAALAVDNARLYQEAQEALRARDEFLSIAAHELRTPLTPIKASAQLLHRHSAEPTLDIGRIRRYASNILGASDRLARLIGDLLDVSRLRSGSMPFRLETVDLQQLTDVQTEEARTRAPRHLFTVERSSGQCLLQADPDRMSQVLDNLLSNASTYAPEGTRITVRVAPGGGGVVLAVADEGIGLPPGAAARIFQPFGRADNARARNLPGSGLGLYICRQIVEGHGGRIWAESPGEGLGTIVRVWVPGALPVSA